MLAVTFCCALCCVTCQSANAATSDSCNIGGQLCEFCALIFCSLGAIGAIGVCFANIIIANSDAIPASNVSLTANATLDVPLAAEMIGLGVGGLVGVGVFLALWCGKEVFQYLKDDDDDRSAYWADVCQCFILLLVAVFYWPIILCRKALWRQRARENEAATALPSAPSQMSVQCSLRSEPDASPPFLQSGRGATHVALLSDYGRAT